MKIEGEWRGRSATLETVDREHAEQGGYVEFGGWVRLYKDTTPCVRFGHPFRRYGIAAGRRLVMVTWEGFNPAWREHNARYCEEQKRKRATMPTAITA